MRSSDRHNFNTRSWPLRGRQQSVLDLVPFAGSPRQVMNLDRDIEFIGEPLQFKFPQMIFEDVCRGERTLLHRQGTPMGRRLLRTLRRPGAGRFSQQKVFQDELPFAGDEWSTANTACRLEIDGLRPHFCSDDLVQGIAGWAAEKRRFIRSRHHVFASLRAASIRTPGKAKLVISHNLRRLNGVWR